jgi:hypothetical protein
MVARACAWRDAAIADGWAAEPMYTSEPLERAARLSKLGFVAQIITRVPMPGDRYATHAAHVHVWGPDGLAITPPNVYSWLAVVNGVRTCSACGATDIDTQRVGFAGRVCAACLPAERARVERPGWTA